MAVETHGRAHSSGRAETSDICWRSASTKGTACHASIVNLHYIFRYLVKLYQMIYIYDIYLFEMIKYCKYLYFLCYTYAYVVST